MKRLALALSVVALVACKKAEEAAPAADTTAAPAAAPAMDSAKMMADSTKTTTTTTTTTTTAPTGAMKALAPLQGAEVPTHDARRTRRPTHRALYVVQTKTLASLGLPLLIAGLAPRS